MSDQDDFERLLEESLADMPAGRRVQIGERVKATVVAITSDAILVDLGGKTEGVLDRHEFLEDDGTLGVAEGDRIEAYVAHTGDEIRLSRQVRPGAGSEELLQEAFEAGIPVEGKVTGVNKGGLEVAIAGKRAFCPVSQIDRGFVEDPASFVGERLRFRITRLEARNVVLSRRAVLEEERAAQAQETWEQLTPGAELEGRVTRIMGFGAFVDLGGVEGLVHVSQISHVRVEDPAEALEVGQTVQVRVLEIDRQKDRISLSMKALEADPWDSAVADLPPGSAREGRVTRIMPFGAFVDLGRGLEGLVHVSELADRRVAHPRDVVQEGEVVQVRVLEVDPERQRIALSLREPPEPVGEVPPVGASVQATVDRIEPYGVFVRFGGHRGLIPASELPAKTAGSLKALRDNYPEGTGLTARIIQVDAESGRIRLSVTAAEADAAAEVFESFKKTQDERSSQGFGTLGDLLKSKLGKD